MTLDATGLTIKRLSEIREEMFALIISLIGAQIQLGVESTSAKFIEIVAIQLAELWELTQQLYFSFDPDAAEGQQLDNLAAIVGVTREPATPSTTTLDITGTPATNIPQGSIYRVPNNGPLFVTAVAAVIPGGGVVNVAMESQETGPIEAPAGSITEQVTIIVGVASVTNPTTAELGRNIETDQELRVRRELSLQIVGAGTDQAIASRVLALTTVDQAVTISNRTDIVDAFGTPGHSVLTVVWPVQADNQPVFTALWATMPGGVLAHGTITGTALDTQGNLQPVGYSLAGQVSIFVSVTLTVGANFPGATAVKDVVEAYVNALTIGGDVLRYQISCVIADLPDIIDLVVTLKANSPPGPGDTANLVIGATSIARVVDPANILVFIS